METGIGGRLDATNIVNPVLSVITSIGYDHCEILGNSLEKIAYEKAGIIKPKRPVVLGSECPTEFLSQIARERKSPCLIADKKSNFHDSHNEIMLKSLQFLNQSENLKISPEALKKASIIRQKCRMELVNKSQVAKYMGINKEKIGNIILDVGHNKSALVFFY